MPATSHKGWRTWLIDWFIHWFIHSFICSFVRLFIHSFIPLFVCLFVRSFRLSCRLIWTCLWDLPLSVTKLSSGKEQNFRSREYSSQVPDYQDFQIIWHQTKGILLNSVFWACALCKESFRETCCLNINFHNLHQLHSTAHKITLTLVWYHGVYVTPVQFDSRFFWNCHEYWHRLLRILS